MVILNIRFNPNVHSFSQKDHFEPKLYFYVGRKSEIDMLYKWYYI